MITLTQQQIKLQEHLEFLKEHRESIKFYKEMIGKLEVKRLKGISGGAKKSQTIEHALSTINELESRLTATLRDNGDSMAFESYDKTKTWHESVIRQKKALEKSQRMRVNVFEFSDEMISEIKERVTILDMVDELKIRRIRSGAARYVICCPFHDERTPSCSIYMEEDKYHCFGCQAHGDVIDFYQNYLGIEFDEALSRLSDKLGINLMDADQVERAEKLIIGYKEFIAEEEEIIKQHNAQYAKEINV